MAMKKLAKLAIRAKLKSPILCHIKKTNNKTIDKIVCTPNGKGYSRTTYTQTANTVPIHKVVLHFRGILAITKANVTIAVSSGIPCKSKLAHEMLIEPIPLCNFVFSTERRIL